ncbi:CaiB/BaiF CoA-transferase family protein [Novosphingobium sp. EMRT-2]|uniref:CaiB/BaiF CoA transferase family protein n=1 Tax=Novosphingobium sp. EMRT-2 TaxID=2571749 RepID=UPI002104E894|nr:CoA transferase [Novosphingobium sp. EMRT-2]
MMRAMDGKPMLEGIKVVDLTSVVFGPYCTHILADLGAEVIKVEAPGTGDAFRWSGKAAATPGMSPSFMAINRGKQSIALDLKAPDDLACMKALLEEADVFVLNVRGKAVERLGLDYNAVRAINPGIIYAHCVGFGQNGPYADLQAYDDVIQAATGTSTLLPRVDGDPRARYLPSLIADKVAGLHAAYAVLAAVIHKLRTGEGQKVEIAMFEAFSHFMLLEHLAGLTFDPPNAPVGYFRQIDPDRQPFPTRDGFISIVPYTDEAWPRVFEVLGHSEFLKDERFATRKARTVNLALLYCEMARLTPAFTTAELVAKCHAAQIPAQPVRDIADIMDDPHLAATGFFSRQEHPSEGGYFAMEHPVRFAKPLGSAKRHAPRLGEQSDRIRTGLKKR